MPDLISSITGASTAHWYAVYTTPRHEKRIAQHLALREIEHFLPLYRTARQWKDGSKGIVELPLFPSYTFVRIELRERVRVLEVPGVLSIVGGRGPVPLPDRDIESLQAGVHLRKVEPHPYLVAGERVRIKSGALTGMEGVLIRQKNEFRVVISLDAITQSMAVEIDASEIEPVGSYLHDRPASARAAVS